VALANVTSGRYRAFVRDTALRRIPRRALRRNALLALGNRPGPASAQERTTLTAAAADEDEQIRRAADRALRRRD
jgi:epoxyqueuosine reductase QueG